MRSIVAATSLTSASAILRVGFNRTSDDSIPWQQSGHWKLASSLHSSSGSNGNHILFHNARQGTRETKAEFGHGECQCVGIDNIDGVTETTAGDYPADLGARCEAWDDERHEKCKGPNKEKWCADQWCYVDPCKCDIGTLPKVSAYLPDAEYQGKPVYYSYATCGSKDQWTDANHKKACVNQKTKNACNDLSKCMWSDEHKKCGGKDVMGYCDKPLKDYKWGEKQCRCIGIDGQGGTTEVKIGKGEYMDYPADVGATCDAWDQDRHPKCKGDDKPGWCADRWCFVDPCTCDLAHAPPKGSFYLPEATFQGKPLFYSYATCGAEDQFMDKKEQKTALKKQQAVCSSAWAASPLVGVLLAFMMI